jgi:hypothetical protein
MILPCQTGPMVFYREATLRMIAAQRGWVCEIPV